MKSPRQPVISIRELSCFRSGAPILDRVSLEIRAECTVGIVGENGAGKSTLLACIAGLVRPSSGSVHVLGCEAGAAGLRRRVSYLPEEFDLCPDERPAGFLAHLGKLQRCSAEDVRRVQQQMGIDDLMHRSCRSLSYGQRRRVALAGMALGTPELVILDEPFAGLDARGRALVETFIAERKPNTTLVASADAADLAMCDEVYVFEQGRPALRSATMPNRFVQLRALNSRKSA